MRFDIGKLTKEILSKQFADALNELIIDALKSKNILPPDSNASFADLNKLLQAQFLRKPGVERPDFKDEPITEHERELIQKLLNSCSSYTKELINPVIFGATLGGMKTTIEYTSKSEFYGTVHVLVSDRPFLRKECDPGNISSNDKV